MIQIKIIYSFDYSNYIDSNLLTETAKLNVEREQKIKNLEEVLKNYNDKLGELLEESIKSLENENLSKIQEVENNDNILIKK